MLAHTIQYTHTCSHNKCIHTPLSSTQTFAAPLVSVIGVRDLELLPMATEYLRIRAVAQPAVLATMVSDCYASCNEQCVSSKHALMASEYLRIRAVAQPAMLATMVSH